MYKKSSMLGSFEDSDLVVATKPLGLLAGPRAFSVNLQGPQMLCLKTEAESECYSLPPKGRDSKDVYSVGVSLQMILCSYWGLPFGIKSSVADLIGISGYQ